MKKNTHFKSLKSIYGIGNSRALMLYNILGINKKYYPLKLKSSQIILLTFLVRPLLISKNLKNFIREYLEFNQKLKTFKSLKFKSKFLLKTN